jgi:hypothetical protein
MNIGDAYDKYCEFLLWLNDQGVATSRGRLQSYKKLLCNYKESLRSGTAVSFVAENKPGRILSMLSEINELLFIYKGLKGQSNVPHLLESFKKLVRGQDTYSEDSAQNSTGRDFGFELSVASLIAQNGAILNNPDLSDIKFSWKDVPFFIEAKNLDSPRKIETNISTAKKQLMERFRSSLIPKKGKGIIALNCTKIINPSFHFHKLKAGIKDPRDVASNQLFKFVETNKEQLKKRMGKQIPAIYLLYTGVFLIKGHPNLVRQSVIYPREDIEKSTKGMIEEVFGNPVDQSL